MKSGYVKSEMTYPLFVWFIRWEILQLTGHRNRPSRLSDSEVTTILLLFHTHRFRDLKSFYLGYVCRHMHREFPYTVSYNRFVEQQAQVGALLLFLQTCALGSAPASPSSTPPR